ncbi:MAG: O-unit flippase-like protein [Eubacteriales bacterium]|nr:O-unit flippase-like protein [Eubacteriales bacterium]
MVYKTALNKKDIFWSYCSKGLSIFSGVITLPLILSMLTEGEIALNYIFISLMQFVVLFDFGFSPQFARNFAFVFGGAKTLTSKGIPEAVGEDIDYPLLYQLIMAAKRFYSYMSIALFFVLVVFGSIYIYIFTDGFSQIDNSLTLWLCFSVSIVVDFFYKFFTPLLQGQGKIKEVSMIDVVTQIIKILSLALLLFLNFGLWAVVISNFLRVIVLRILSYKTFYTKEIISKFKECTQSVLLNVKGTLLTLWYNAKRSLVVSITNFTSMQLGLFFSGLFLDKTAVSGYGLLTQLVGIISTISVAVGMSNVPIYSSLRANNATNQIHKNFYFSLGVFYSIYIIGALFLLYAIPPLLSWIHSNAALPSLVIVIIVLIYKFLEGQHVLCSSYLTTQNVIVDFESSTILGIANFLLLWAVLAFTKMELLGVVIVPAITALAYPNWKWPYEICKEFNISYFSLLHKSFFSLKDFFLSVIEKG